MVDWNRVAADTNYRETIVLAAEAQAIVDKERADEVSIQPPLSLCVRSASALERLANAVFLPCTMPDFMLACLSPHQLLDMPHWSLDIRT